jgi:N-acetylmuramidase
MNQVPLNFKGAAKRLDAIDVPLAAHRLNLPEDAARALVEVEAASSGFDAKGRPKMLFEPHRFYRELGEAKQRIAVNAGLAYRRWGEKPYPADSYPRLEAAIKIDRPAALRSASWGLPQILGSNHKAAGYASVEAMVADFCADEEYHLRAMMAFILSEALDDDLRRLDWAGFARVYNGPAYAKHGYHTKLAAAYAKWQQRPDTPIPASAR